MSSASKQGSTLGNLYKVKSGVVMSELQILQAVVALPDGALLTSDEAAVFLRMSKSSLERLRYTDHGPRYQQIGGATSPCKYLKRDLLEWIESTTSHNAIGHAKIKGLTFATLQDVAEQAAFYVDDRGNVESLVEANSINTVVERIGVWAIDWLTPAEACGRSWLDLGTHKQLAGAVSSTLSRALQAVERGLEATELLQISIESSKEAATKREAGDD